MEKHGGSQEGLGQGKVYERGFEDIGATGDEGTLNKKSDAEKFS